MREALPFVLLVCACGAAAVKPWTPPAPEAKAAVPSALPASSGTDAPAASAVFAALAARAPALAPGMHEVARLETADSTAELLHAAPSDACVRVAYEADAPVEARLVDQAGRELAETDAAAPEGVLATEGPVCVRKGDSVVAVTEGRAARVLWIAWGTQGD